MSVVDEREQALHNLVRLRRARRASPHDEDLAIVGRNLERDLGPTVRRSVAARSLGVSQTALDRWIRRGEIPAVLTPGGRSEVPVHALIELIEEVESMREAGERRPLAAVLRARRAEADRIRREAVVPSDREPGAAQGHRAAELRSLAYHRAVAQRLDRDLVRDAQERLRRWREEGHVHPRYASAWEEVLSQPIERIAELITREDEHSAALRQSSPFAGALSESARRRVLELAG